MSNSNTTSADGSRKLTAVLSNNTDLKPLKIVRPSALAKDGITGVVAEGIYMGTTPNRFEPLNNDFRINGDVEDFILNTSGSLASQLSKVDVGTYVQIQYAGKRKAKSGAAEGKMVHNFIVLKEDSGS